MCYLVYLSTECADDLSRQTSDLVRLERPPVDWRPPGPHVLTHPHNWFVGSKSGCSCTFRHLHRDSVSLGFEGRQDWFPEDDEAIEATRQLYEILRDLVDHGHRVELLDCWSEEEDRAAVPLDVSLSQVPPDAFRLFEGHLFKLRV